VGEIYCGKNQRKAKKEYSFGGAYLEGRGTFHHMPKRKTYIRKRRERSYE